METGSLLPSSCLAKRQLRPGRLLSADHMPTWMLVVEAELGLPLRSSSAPRGLFFSAAAASSLPVHHRGRSGPAVQQLSVLGPALPCPASAAPASQLQGATLSFRPSVCFPLSSTPPHHHLLKNGRKKSCETGNADKPQLSEALASVFGTFPFTS